MSKEIFDDETLLEGFKNLRDIVQAQKELNQLFDKRLKLLEASQFRQPLVLTKEMEVKNQRMVPHQTLSHLKNYKVGTTPGCTSHRSQCNRLRTIWTDPWSYQVDTLVLSMDLTADKTWDQCERNT